MNFCFVQYGGNSYPEGIKPALIEVAGHLDKEKISNYPDYSLHTEYSYGKRNLSSSLINKFPELCKANKDGVPQLWKCNAWAEQFADFVVALTKERSAPKVIEIHPPFSDYCNLEQFIERYSVFEHQIHETYPFSEIVIENRAGSVYHGGKFIISKAKDIASLCHIIQITKLNLGVVLDFPQLLTAENIKPEAFDQKKYFEAIDTLYPDQSTIKGIHVWGKKKNSAGRWVAHNGNLDTYFTNPINKQAFISGIRKICSDGQYRYFVPEVNSGENDLKSVVRDILS